jgi:hypothetical protein
MFAGGNTMKTMSKIALSLPLFAGLIFAGGYLRFKQTTYDRVRSIFSAAEQKEDVVTPEMLAGLPEPVQRYLRYAGVVGKPLVSTVRLRQEGRIRQDEESPWMPLRAEEYYTVSPPTFIWQAGARVAGLPLMRVRDHYVAGSGRMFITLGGLFAVGDTQGPEMDQGGMMRYLNEMMWFPAAFLSDYITWEAIDDHSARVLMTDHGRQISAVLTFDDEGRLTNFTGERYRDNGDGTSDLVLWSTPVHEYGEFEGVRVPVRGSGVWHLESGDLTYIELEILDVEYNRPELY